LIRRTDDSLLCSYDENKFVGINSVHCIQSIKPNFANKFLLSQINSKLCNWFFRHENFHMVGKPLAEVKVVFVERLPIKTTNNPNDFLIKVENLIGKNEQVYDINNKFIRYLLSKIAIQEPTNKLLNWNDLKFSEFISEINSLIKKSGSQKLSKSDEMDWMEFFENKRVEIQNLKSEIEKIDKEIDQMVYELYGLTASEIKIVEGS